MTKEIFGTMPDGREVERYTLKSDSVQVDILTLGATIAAVRTPDKNGVWADIALGFDTPEEYIECPWCLGATIGRYAGRIANGRFVLNGKLVQVAQNRGDHMIHGGTVGFHQRVWEVCRADDTCLELKLFSEDGDQGFPGAMTVWVTFLLENNILTLEYSGTSSADTPFNMTNHVYWNLAGHSSGTIDEHVLMVPAQEYLETDKDKIPTGRVLQLKDYGLDLRCPVKMESVHADYSFLLPDDGKMNLAGTVYEPSGGRWLKVMSDLPSVQVYTADGMAVMEGKNGAIYGPRKGMCLETQFYPDAPNHENFPSAILRAGEEATHRICWKFGVDEGYALDKN